MEVMMSGRANKCPFTATQWQELENQALIFKYMASGHPIPPDLILHIRRSILLDSCSGSVFPFQPNFGWGCFQMGFGRKAEDPEPGRCRRTDGKKWRCSKEAYPDSKYCERHMHRGKNRSRKPVEMSLNNTQSSTNTSSSNSSSFISMAANETQRPMYSSFSRPPPAMGLSPQTNTTHYPLDSGSSPDVRDYRSFHGLKEGMNQFSCFPEPKGAARDGSWTFTPLGTSSLGEAKHQNSYFGTDISKQGIDEEKEHQSIVFGTDFKLGRDGHEENEKPIRHFFSEWPQKSKETWMGLEEDQSFSKTQLSISIPWAHHQEFPSSLDNSHSETGH